MKKKAYKGHGSRVVCLAPDVAQDTRRKIQGAFTLLELLIAVTIFSIIAVTLYASFYTGIRILRKSGEVMNFHQDLRMAAGEMGRDLRNCIPCPLYEGPRKEGMLEDEEESVYFFLGERKKFSFVTLKDVLSKDGVSRREICNVTYYFEGADNGKLMRDIGCQGSGYAAGTDEEKWVLAGVGDMEVLYSYEGEEEDSEPVWLDTWRQEEKVPLGVKVRLRLKRAGSLKGIAKTVFIPVGVLGVREEAYGL